MDSADGFRSDNIKILNLAPEASLCCDSTNDKMREEIVTATQIASQQGVRPHTMPPPDLDAEAPPKHPVVLLAGATGYVGGRLIPLLAQEPVMLRCLARNPEKLRASIKDCTQVVQGDVLNAASLDKALQGVHTAYYLVHLMSGSKDFEKEDRQAAENFAAAVKKAGVRRIIYLGGLGDDADPKLSPHLRSRHAVGRILRDSGVETIEFRASLVIGAGSLSFDLVKWLTDRLPVMLCPS